MNQIEIGNLLNKLKRHNQIRLVLCIFMIVFAFPLGKVCGRTIKNVGINNPKFKKIFQTYENIQVNTEKEKELKKEIDRLVFALQSALKAMAGGTGFLVFLIMIVGGINFLERYFSEKRYLKIIEELLNASGGIGSGEDSPPSGRIR